MARATTGIVTEVLDRGSASHIVCMGTKREGNDPNGVRARQVNGTNKSRLINRADRQS